MLTKLIVFLSDSAGVLVVTTGIDARDTLSAVYSTSGCGRV